MGELDKLTSKEAVEEAARDFVRLGRRKFLAAFGYQQSRKLIARVGEHLIDSKPLLSTAYGCQYPAEGRLDVSKFSGGPETERALARFGIDVVDVTELESPRASDRTSSARHYGEVPGYPPGSISSSRRVAFEAGVHRTTQAGIAGQSEGTQSICLSAGTLTIQSKAN